MAANKIRLTYLWADEAVMADDFRRKISKQMSEYARDFFGRYGFELDVRPGYEPGKVLERQRFALQKNDGVRPDPNAAMRILLESIKRKIELIRILQERSDLLSERQALSDRLFSKLRADLAANDLAAAKATTAALAPARKEVEEAVKLLTEANERSAAEEKESQVTFAKEDFQTKFRQQMGVTYLAGISEDKRLNVVFCRYVTHFLTMRGSTFSTTGETFGRLRSPLFFFQKYWLWPYPFVTLSIDGAQPKNLAHEIVHAAGHHAEAPSATKVKDLQRYVSYTPKPLTGSWLERAATAYQNTVEYQSLFEEVPGGYFEGESVNDIMNYDADDKDPSASNLADADKKLLEAAFFVVP